MADVAIGIVSGLFVLTGLAVYSALRLAKRTDEITAVLERDEKHDEPLDVWFPESVFVKQEPKRTYAKR